MAVIVAADAISQYFAFNHNLPKDLRMSMALYGDGAGALVAVKETKTLPAVDSVTMVSTAASDCPGIVLTRPLDGRGASFAEGDEHRVAYHDFRRVLEKGGKLTRDAADAVLSRKGVSFDDIDHILTHQATGNLKRVAASLGIPSHKVHVNIERVGNTLSPSTLILFDQLKRQNVFRTGELLLLCSAESATWSYGGMAVDWR